MAGETLGLKDVAKVLQEVSGLPGVEQVSLGDLETWLKVAERFVPLLERASKSILSLKGQDSLDGQADGGGGGLVIDVLETYPKGSPAPAVEPVAGGPVDASSALVPAAGGAKMALRAYQMILGEMGKLDPSATMADALKQARDHKTVILALLESQYLPALVVDDD
jgi:hypothetical protein